MEQIEQNAGPIGCPTPTAAQSPSLRKYFKLATPFQCCKRTKELNSTDDPPISPISYLLMVRLKSSEIEYRVIYV